ncbi:uncharacterized protein LOC141590313 [Silene latifolia]|uniref:uncharacterized protein LOC141590313 n=1 Tax=Silene latifolia TaxID=37657 RepID=UPI003D7743FE
MPFDDMAPLVFDATNHWNYTNPTVDGEEETIGVGSSIPDGDASKVFDKLVEDMEAMLYTGCETYKRLEFIVLHRAFNYDKNFPESAYEAKKYTKALGLDYVKIDACINHCILFRKEFANEEKCPKCLASRWKEKVVQGCDEWLQRMFISSKLAAYMRWHKNRGGNADDDGDEVMRHPSDSEAWKDFDKQFPDFALDARNVRLGLATDGFNPGGMSCRYSIWPVMLVPYNLPPWMCMKSDNIMLSLLIPGPKAPGNDIDVFLQPLIDELKELWDNGVQTCDAHTKTTFSMRAVLLWTINDFPAYANLSGWSTKRTLACPCCHKDTESKRLLHGRKWCYVGYRKFLEVDHKWRLNRSCSFGRKVERGPPPTPLTGHDVLEQLSGYSNVEFGKNNKKKRAKGERYIVHQWKKISIFFQLPYWKHLLLRHNIDVMHVEKNVCESILGTLLDLPGKNKDSLKARLDLVGMKMHDQLQPKKVEENKYEIPPAPYNLPLTERRKIVTFLSKLAFPDAYSSNISRCSSIEDGKIFGMKSHDFHVFIQDLLTPALQGVLDEELLEPLREFGLFFKQLTAKTLKVSELNQMEKNIAVTLCKLERLFVPAFFDVMIHLPIHLAAEAKLGGPVHYRWMYRFER